jgi:hypothetical protein
VRGPVPRREVEAAQARIAGLGRYLRRPAYGARLALYAGADVPWVSAAHAQIVLPGRVLAARTVGPSAGRAAEEAAVRLRRQLLGIGGASVALRNEPRVIGRALRRLTRDDRPAAPIRRVPPEARRVVPRHTYAIEPESTVSAVADLLDLDEQFHLFSHVGTREDVVVHWRRDRRLALLHPRGSALADERDVVIPMPSRYSDPLDLDTARAEMDELEHRFLYFIAAGDERGRVLYQRLDGDYGLVQPW